MLRRFYPYLRPHLPRLLLAIACMGVVSISLGGQVFLIRHLFDDLLIRRDRELLPLLPLAIIALYGTQALAEIGRGYLCRKVALEVVLTLRNALFEHFQRLPLAYLHEQAAGSMVSRVMHDVDSVQRAITTFITILQKPLTLAVLIAAAVVQEPRLTVIALIGLPLVVLPIHRLGRRLRRYTSQGMDSVGKLHVILQESILGARILRAFSMEEAAARRFRLESGHQFDLSLKATLATLLAGPIVQSVAAVGAAVIVWVGGNEILEGRSSPGTLLAFLVSLGLMNDPLKSLAQVPLLLSQTRVGLERVFEILDVPSGFQDAPDAVDLKPGPCVVTMRDVTFGYGSGPVLRNISLEARAGEMVALVGGSGSGKSTLLNLLLRFYDVHEGTIEIDGIELRRIRLASLRRHLAIVTQETFLFNATIRENIAAGDESYSAGEIEAAARRAHADGFIQALPDGYETRVGDLGVRLSGGQRQRIAIARALLRNAPILLLDEATASLDQASEEEVQRALEPLMASRTIFVVAHRLSTIRHADRIVVLEEGRVIEVGDHRSLMARGGRYAHLYSRQQGGGMDELVEAVSEEIAS